jgi:hypothetical protein
VTGCGRQTSVTAGTTAWFWAADLMAYSNGISALQLQRQLSFRLLQDGVADFSLIDLDGERAATGGEHAAPQFGACRSKDDPVTGGGGRSHQGKMG